MKSKERIHSDLDLGVERPGRYVGGELGSVVKEKASLRAALLFPDVYEVAMSNLGLRILYDLINSREEWAAERVFSPWPDREARLREAGEPLGSLETNRSLKEFDWVGITLPYELSYTNVLNALELGGLPTHAVDRGEEDPIVMAGGSCAANPAPMERFFDCLFIGEAETQLINILESTQRSKGRPRSERLKELESIPGVYLPKSLGGEARAVRQWVRDLDEQAVPPAGTIVPNIRTVHDRISMEISRGCARGCRFCQAGFLYRPLRHRAPEEILNSVEAGVRETGLEEVSFLALSAQDHPEVYELTRELRCRLDRTHTSLSFPSQRVDAFNIAVLKEVQKERKTGVTLAPEVGSNRMERVINKGIDLDRIYPLCDEIFAAGWRLIKLYFMIGLPLEEDTDVEAVAEMLIRLGREARRHKGGCRFNVTISVFAPKPHTPFQWSACASREVIERRARILRERLENTRNVDLKISGRATAALESTLARGDERLGAVIESVWRKGGRFEAWSERFDLSRWEEAFRENGLDLWGLAETQRTASLETPLPWDGIDIGLTREFLLDEWRRAGEEVRTPYCAVERCNVCGLERFDCPVQKRGEKKGSLISSSVPPVESSVTEEELPAAQRLNFVFSRDESVRFLGQLDVARVFERAIRRAGLPVNYSQGFNPRPRLSFVAALSLGFTSQGEWASVELREPLRPEEFVERLNRVLPEGIRIRSAEDATGKKNLSKRHRANRFRIDFEEEVEEAALLRPRERFEEEESLSITRPAKKGGGRGQNDRRPKERVIDLKALVLKLESGYSSNEREKIPFMRITLAQTQEGSANPLEFLEAAAPELTARITRVEREEMIFSPAE